MPSRFGLITRIWNTSCLQRNSIDGRLGGLFSSLDLISPCIIDLVDVLSSWMPCPGGQIMEGGRVTMKTSLFSNLLISKFRHSNRVMPLSMVRRLRCYKILGRPRTWMNRWSRQLKSSRKPTPEGLKDRNGLKNKVLFYSEERSMFQRIWSSEGRLLCYIMMVRQLVTQENGRLWNWSLETIGGLG